MDFNKIAAQAKSALGNNGEADKKVSANNEGSSSSGGGGFMGMLNNAAGGGAQGEKNEDMLDKGIDTFQEHVLGQGQQSNETAAEQAKDEAIAGYIRKGYKSATGSDFPIEDKERKYGL
ncbi:hypothetical protein TD95_000134 [Thielaviopsis punctulata]|uniref:DNA damage-responsive protein 48 n=1 Tax=Thielaviopsis punctulata TaxID=72032 RepID=A0A0F4Z7W4_9PEZI|nr:hypothetical protein TD95_000134 [Thielaviopsis punctulata]